jgi:hypothetical protein
MRRQLFHEFFIIAFQNAYAVFAFEGSIRLINVNPALLLE